MKRLASLIAVVGGVGVAVASLAGGATAARTANALPTLNIAVTGTNAISVSGSEVSGAVNIVSSFSGKVPRAAGPPAYGLIRANPDEPPAVALAKGKAAVQKARGDLNALTALGDAVVVDAEAPGTTQAVLTPGTWLALNLSGNSNNPPMALFNVSQSPSPAALPAPSATVNAIDFGFRGAATLHPGELVRFENDGFLVHMIVGIRVKNAAFARLVTAALKAGKDKLAQAAAIGFANFAGPLSPGGMQQEVITAKPGVYVLACFMNAQDRREHTQLGMERTIKIT